MRWASLNNKCYALLIGLLLCVGVAPAWAGDQAELIRQLKEQLATMQQELSQKQLQLNHIQATLNKLNPSVTMPQPQFTTAEKHKPKISFSDADEVLFSDATLFETGDAEQVTPGWLSTFNVNGNMALRYRAANNRAFTNEFTDTFRLSDFNLDFSFQPTSHVDVALGLQMVEVRTKKSYLDPNKNFQNEGKAQVLNILDVKYGYADYHYADWAVLRFGAFLTPFGVYNESLHADYDSKLVELPFLNEELVPAPWTQVGLSVYGNIKLNPAWSLDYNIYTGNGLEAPVSKKGGSESNRIADMNHVLVSRYNSHRAYGGRLGMLGNKGAQNFELGGSLYHGAWDALGHYNLDMLGLDAWYRYQGFEMRGEWTMALQDLPLRTEYKHAWYAQAAYRWKAFEPVIRTDRITQSYTDKLNAFVLDHRWRYSLGLNAYLSKFFVLKSSFSRSRIQAVPNPDNVYMMTLTAGF